MSDEKKNGVMRDSNGRIVSGALNPGGGPQLPKHMRYRCREIVDELVIEAWREEVLNRGDYWIKASALLAAYGYGLPKQELKLEGERPAKGLTTEELRVLARRQLASERRDDEPEPH